MKRLILILASILISSTAMAEDVVLYSYDKTSQKPAEWAIMPVTASLPNTAPETLFEALKRRKMPTYGATEYNAAKEVITIDDSKCAYSTIISGEIGHTFRAYRHPIPQIVCAGKNVPSALTALPHYAAVIPLWQALNADAIHEPAVIQVGEAFYSADQFSALVKKQDKSLIRAIEADFNDPNLFVKTDVMRGYLKFSNGEKRVARELSNPANVAAAMAALANTKDAAIIAQMKTILTTPGDLQEGYALSMIGASNADLRDASLVILLKSANDVNFTKAVQAIEKSGQYELVKAHSDDILSAMTPTHAPKLVSMLVSHNGEQNLSAWLDKNDSAPASQAVAMASLEMTKTDALRRVSQSVLLLNGDPDVAFDALDALMAASSEQNLWQHGLKSAHTGIRWASFEKLEIPPFSKVGQEYFEAAKSAPNEAVPRLTADAYNADVNVRRDIARTTEWLDNAGDSLRSILLKDSDDDTASLVILLTSRRPASEISLPLFKEMTARAERSKDVKIALLHAMPRMMNEKTVQTIATYAGNEMFDADMSIKIAAIRALSDIARLTSDPVVADNAVTSLALTAQDKSKSVVHHTIRALERTKLPAAQEIIDKFKQ